MADISEYLKPGPQTQLTSLVYEHAEKASDTELEYLDEERLPETAISVYKTCKYISDLTHIEGFDPNAKTDAEKESNEVLKDSVFRQRDLDQILREGPYPTCSDVGVLFRGLLIAQEVSVAYVEAFHEDYLFKRAFHTHSFGRVFYNDKSLIVDPMEEPIIVEQEKEILPYTIFREGLDSWDIGIYKEEDLHRLRRENLSPLLERYENNLRTVFQEKLEDLEMLKKDI